MKSLPFLLLLLGAMLAGGCSTVDGETGLSSIRAGGGNGGIPAGGKRITIASSAGRTSTCGASRGPS